MVDCGNPRCAQERRFFKKELLSWSKKVPLMIALEQIAANYSDKQHRGQLADPYTSLEDIEEAGDWQADVCCFYCQGQLSNSLDHLEQLLQDVKDGRLEADNPYVHSLQDLLPYYIRYYTDGLGRDLLAGLGSRPSYSTTLVTSSPVTTLASHSVPDVKEVELSGPAAHGRAHVELKIPRLRGRGKKSDIPSCLGAKRGYTEEDLQAAVVGLQRGKLGMHQASSLYGIPQSTLRNKIYRSGPEMDSPQQQQQPLFCQAEDSNSDDEASVTAVSNDVRMAELIQSGALPFPSPVPMSLFGVPGVEDEDEEGEAGGKGAGLVCDEFAVKLEHIRRMHNLRGDREAPIRPAHLSEPRLPVLTSLMRRLVKRRFRMEVDSSRHSNSHKWESRSESRDRGFVGSRTCSPVHDDRKTAAISVDTLPSFLPYLPAFSPSCLASLSVPSSLEDLRIPSYQPASLQQQTLADLDPGNNDNSRPVGKVYEASRIGETLTDIIVKSISKKMKFHDLEAPALFPSASDLFGHTFPLTDAFPLDFGKSAFRSCHTDLSQPTLPAKRIKRESYEDQEVQVPPPSHSVKSQSCQERPHSRSKGGGEQRGHGRGEGKASSSNSTQAAGSSSGSGSKARGDGSVKEKKTRPKRGQYRKYNSQLLIEAVRAVQRGEMSVHRAGSYFGVPHSTLEYKVKERHLLRQKKPRETSGSGNNSSSTSGSSASGSATNNNSSTSTTTVTTNAAFSSSLSSSSTLATTSWTSSISFSTASSTTQTGKSSMSSFAVATSSHSPPLSASSSSSSSSSGKAESSLPAAPTSPTSSLSALGFGLHKPGGVVSSGGVAGGDYPLFQPYLESGSAPLPFDPALSLFPQGFALNTSASELLRKLQHKVQGKSSPSSPFSPQSPFGFAHPNGSSSMRESFLLFN